MILAEERTTEEERMHIMEGLCEVFFPPRFICCWTSKLIYLSPPFTNTQTHMFRQKLRKIFTFSNELNFFQSGTFSLYTWQTWICGDFSVLIRKALNVWVLDRAQMCFVHFQDVVNTQSTFYISCRGRPRGRKWIFMFE